MGLGQLDVCCRESRKNLDPPEKCFISAKGGELAQWWSTHPLIQRSPVRFRARPHTGVMDYDEACFMHLIPGVVHNFPKAVGV